MANSQKSLMRTSVRLLCAEISKQLQNILYQLKNKKTRRRWFKKWILRHNTLGAYSKRLLQKFATEDESLYRNRLRINI